MSFSTIDLGQYPQLPFNYHEPMVGVTKDGKDYRVYYTNTRDYHIVIIEAYDASGSYYASFKNDHFMIDGVFDRERDLSFILGLMNDRFRIHNVLELQLALRETVDDIFGHKK